MTNARIQLELAGFLAGDGQLGRHVLSDAIHKPGQVKLVDGGIVASAGVPRDETQPGPALLDNFRRLASSDNPNQVLNFARRWGVIPAVRIPGPYDPTGKFEKDGLFLDGECWYVGPYFDPPPVPVHFYSKLAKAFDCWVSLAAKLQRGQKITATDIVSAHLNVAGISSNYNPVLVLSPEVLETFPAPELGELVREALAEQLNKLLSIAGVQPGVRVEQNRFVATVCFSKQPATLGALTVQLLPLLTGARGLLTCSGCGQAYLRGQRAPRADGLNFCKDCGNTVAARLRKRKERAKHHGKA